MAKKRAGKDKKISIILILLIMLIFVILAVIFMVSQKQTTGECTRDSDCIKVQTTCCSCTMGGKEVCASKTQAENLTAKNCPADLMCIALYNCKIKSCSCVQGKCEGKE